MTKVQSNTIQSTDDELKVIDLPESEEGKHSVSNSMTYSESDSVAFSNITSSLSLIMTTTRQRNAKVFKVEKAKIFEELRQCVRSYIDEDGSKEHLKVLADYNQTEVKDYRTNFSQVFTDITMVVRKLCSAVF